MMADDAAGADATVRRIADYACGLSFSDLPPAAVHACKRRIADTLGCAVAAFDAEPCRIARGLALRAEAAGGARVLGTARRALPELAAFANAAMGRYLDGNDCFPGGGGHPSGVIAPVLAAAQLAGADAKAAIAAIVVGYEVHRALHESLRVMTKGFDHAFYPAVAAAAAAANVLRLDRARAVNAIALAVTANLPLAVTRRGQLSMWKGVAEANGARNGLFAALLAQAGMTGPDRPFEGALGLHHLVGPVDPGLHRPRPARDRRRRHEVLRHRISFAGPARGGAVARRRAGRRRRSPRSTSAPTRSPTTRSAAAPRSGARPPARPPITACPGSWRPSLIDGAFSDAIFCARALQRSARPRARRPHHGRRGAGVHPARFRKNSARTSRSRSPTARAAPPASTSRTATTTTR